ncbi:acyl-CoA thioesterase [Pseudalkalibacillus sp. R45]|uniref:acyl-CoA thioesterase n=1 Tax=Pseudalkalibacillus sp. R45 TaxID=3457433 RepID=UPI003FCE05BC
MAKNFEIVVRSTEIDGNGHVNNAKFLEYLEWARQEWSKTSEIDKQKLDLLGINLVTVNININFKREALEGDILTINTELERVGRSSFTLSQKIYNQYNHLIVEAMTTRVVIDNNKKESCAIPEKLKVVLNRIYEQIQ